jgi:DNA-binding NtrC family response regulator/CHASE2 domain-containing sensor protein
MNIKYIFKKEFLISLLAAGFIYIMIPFFNNTQKDLNYWLMRRHVSNRFKSPIYIVYFDEDDIQLLGGWPLSRNIYGYLAEKLFSLGAEIVGFDIFWGDRADASDENDMFLASVLNKQNSIVGSFYFSIFGHNNSEEKPVPDLGWIFKKEPQNLMHASSIQTASKMFLKGRAKFGFVNLPFTNEGIIEEAALLVKSGDIIYPSFSNLISRIYKQNCADSSLSEIKINYTVNTKHLPIISIREIIHEEDTERLKQKLGKSIVIAGIISSQIGFEKATPIDASMPVIGIHAQIIDNILTGNYLKTLPQWIYSVILFIVILIPVIFRINRMRYKYFLLTVCAFLFTVSTLILWKHCIIFELYACLTTLLFISIIFMFDSVFFQKKQFREEIEKRKLLEIQFRDKVQSSAYLEKEYIELQKRYRNEIEGLREELSTVTDEESTSILNEYPDIVCSHKSPMIKILSELSRIGETDQPVFISGESGTGKELIAKSIHQKSRRKEYPFIAVNCSSLSENLLESELFGHEKGSFTGANQAKSGFFEAADKGTIFLDEISETSVSFQAKLLRILQEGTFFRVGSTKIRNVDVRVIAATNQNIDQMIEQGHFRQDLFFRLNVLPVHLPPLRERPEDIPLLVSHFLGRSGYKISSGAQELLKSYNWPGNIRELQNLSARMKILEEGSLVTSDWIKKQLSLDDKSSTSLESMDENILLLYREMKFRNDSNVRIAEKLGNLHRSTITEYLKGMTFQFFCEEDFDLNNTVRRFNPDKDDRLDLKIRNRMVKYLKNLISKLDLQLSTEENIQVLQTHIRKLPVKYHQAVIEIAKSYLQGGWQL